MRVGPSLSLPLPACALAIKVQQQEQHGELRCEKIYKMEIAKKPKLAMGMRVCAICQS